MTFLINAVYTKKNGDTKTQALNISPDGGKNIELEVKQQNGSTKMEKLKSFPANRYNTEIIVPRSQAGTIENKDLRAPVYGWLRSEYMKKNPDGSIYIGINGESETETGIVKIQIMRA